ncbi:MAG: PAS domain S-box protein [Desmonostoc vinosum HA7617-LM4]|jgi:diguanylate cyclase (GGDEF)-like protein/PAS domain S-box-containing protein|nr:PAS domain S-box protein [Desmonostoc vinosum HA7617-LM4]
MLRFIRLWNSIYRWRHLLGHCFFIVSIFVVLIVDLGKIDWIVLTMMLLLGFVIWRNAHLFSQLEWIYQQAKKKLMESEYQFHQVFEQAPFVMQLYANDGTLLQTNQVWEEVWGDSRNVLKGYNVLQDAQIASLGHLPYLKRVFAGETVTFPPLFYNPALNGHQGRSRWLEGSAYPIKNDTGKVDKVVLVTKDITDYKQAEVALQLSQEQLHYANKALETRVAERTAELAQANILLQNAQERWQLVIQGSQDGIWDWNIVTGKTLRSHQCSKLLGYEPNEISNSNQQWMNRIHPDDIDRVKLINLAYLTQKIPNYATEYRYRCKDGSYRWFQSKAKAVWDEQGNPQRMVGSMRDITAQKQIEIALQESEERLQLAFEASGDGLWDWNIVTGEVYFSPQWLEMLGYSVGELPGEVSTWERLIHPEDQPWVMERLNAYLQDRFQPYDFDYRVLTKSGEWKWISNYGKVVACDQQGKPIRMTGTHKDISDRKQAEEALQERSQHLATVIAAQQEITKNGLDLTQVMSLIVDRAQQLTHADGAVIAMVEGKQLVYHAASGIAATRVGLSFPVTTSLCGRCVETGEILGCEDTATDPRVDITACQSIGVRSLVAIPLFQQEKCVGVLKILSSTNHAFTEQSIQTLQLIAGFLTDTILIASEFQAKNKLLTALERSETRYRSVIAAMAEGVVLQDAHGAICASNASAEEILGLSLDQMMGRTSIDSLWRTIHEDGSPFLGEQHPAMVTLRTGEPCQNVIMGVHKPQGSMAWISINTQPLVHPGEITPYAVVTSFSDITDRQQAEEEILLLQKLALEIGESSDFNSALGQVLRSICQTSNWQYGEAWIPCQQSNVLKCNPAFYINVNRNIEHLFHLLAFRSATEALEFSLGTGLPGRVWASQQPEWQEDVSQQSEQVFLRCQSAGENFIKTGLGIPVIANGQVLAVLVFFKFEVVAENKRMVKNLMVIAAQLSLVLKRKQVEAALQESEARFQAFMNHNPVVAFMKDEAGRYVYANQSLERIFNVNYADLLGKTDFDWLPEEIARQLSENDATVLATGQVMEVIETVPTPDGILYYWLVFKFPFQDAAGAKYVGGVAVDITERKRMEEALFQEKELAQVTLHSIGDAVITTDAIGKIEYFNPIAENLTGWSQQEVRGLPLVEVFKIVNENTREPVENPVEKALQQGQIVELANHTILITRSGDETAIEDSASPIRDRNGQMIGAVMVFHDVTQNRTLSRQLSWQASHDALTELPNRREFEQRLAQALSFAKSDNQVHALCYLDLDRFKIINDTCGHTAGDELLRQITTLLQKQIRKSDTLARLGGDEFGVLLNQCTLEQALWVANKLRECVQEFRFVWQEQIFSIGVSIGLVSIDADTENLTEIISAADAACYTAKNRGRNRVYVVRTDDQELMQQRGEMQWVNRIAQALEGDQFCLYAQPIASINPTAHNGEHYEVLLRLRDEQGNLVSPMTFIPAAERYNLMHLIDRWVIRSLFKDWSKVVNNEESIYAINLSGSSINDDQFIEFLYEQFASHPIAPQRICFEITETVAIANLTKASQFIQELQTLGCRFALDDFGAGMSSFAYLKSLPVDYLKIDGGFIRNIVDNSVDDAIVAAITYIGNVMGIRTIAEFVENKAILERITALGIDYAQGYGIAEPRPLIASVD